MKLIAGTVLFLSAATSPIQAQDGSISIKDLRLGLSRTGIYNNQHQACDAALFAKYHDSCFTIGGSPISNLQAAFGADSKVEAFRVEFDAEHYDAIKAAVITKYPLLKCLANEVQNKMGAKFQGENCIYRTTRETLSLQKYGTVLTTGWLAVGSNTWLEMQESAKNKKKSDI